MNLPRRRRWADEIRNWIVEIKGLVNEQYLKRARCVLRRVTQCPECRGSGTVPSILWAKKGNSYGYLTGARPQPIVAQMRIAQENCLTCNGTGKI